ncbi:MAG: AMP-binding protein [Magnetococcales bacterium]|nr:AMP-binding protein [Magnetococcales bacterium]
MWQDFIQEQGRLIPDKLALIDRLTGRQLTYAQLDREVCLWTRHLAECNLEPGDRVAYLAANRLEHITLFFACTRLGTIFVPLNHRLAPQELAEILTRIKPSYFLAEGEPPLPNKVAYQPIQEITLTEGPSPPAAKLSGHTPLLMLFTSGSTGQPKGVLFHADMLMANITQTIAAGVLQPGDISLVNTPFFHTGGYNVFCLPLLYLGGTLILFEKFDPDGVLQAIGQDGVTVFWAVPTMFQAIYEAPNFSQTDFSTIRFFLSGGAPLSLPLIQAYQQQGVPFKQGFGLTEVGPNCFLHETEESYHHPDSIGRPMAHSRVKVVNAEGQEVKPGEVGELLIGGPHLCLGYWQDEEGFQEALRGDYFATGDLVRVDEKGLFYVVGRQKEMYISGGENVFPGEVEKQLVTHPAITQVVVVGVADKKWTEVGSAFYVGNREIGLAEMRDYLTPLLARYKHPHHIQRLTALPLLANGKIDRKTVEERAKKQTGEYR